MSSALARAKETAESLDCLKISGISIALGAVLEELLDRPAAYDVYAAAHSDLITPSSSSRTVRRKERMRAVALSMRLAELANAMRQEEREEMQLVWATEEVLRLSRGIPEGHPLSGETTQPEEMGALQLPAWVDKTDAASVLERLGEFYAQRGKIE